MNEPQLRDIVVEVELEAIQWLASGRGLTMLRESMVKAVRAIDAHQAAKRTKELAEWQAGQTINN
jgi:hypothetical protein